MYVCTKCNSDQVESLQWVDLNTQESENDDTVGEYYCRSCGAHTDVTWTSGPNDDLDLDDEDEISVHSTDKPLTTNENEN